jgi:phosphate/sulfate permease
MLFLVFISSGLFLGWSLGANDAANIFGSAVGSKMISFKRAAWIASIFVVLGSVLQGQGGADTLNALGTVDALPGAFTVSLCSALIVFAMTRRSLPVSTSQAIVGAIVGWSLFSGNPADYKVLGKIVTTWVSGPVLGMIFSAGLFLLLRNFLKRTKIHVIKLDYYIRISLILTGAFGAYSLGANNIANVMGVFVNSAPTLAINLGFYTITGTQLLFLVGGIAISVGIFTYSQKVMEKVGNGILALTPEAALVVVLSQALVLFLFSSKSLANMLISWGIPPIPLVPVSSTQLVIGALIGIGLIKGIREIRISALAGVAAGWIITPIVAGALTFFSLFIVQNVFGLQVSKSPVNQIESIASKQTPTEIIVSTPTLWFAFITIGILILFLYFTLQNKKLKNHNTRLKNQIDDLTQIRKHGN